MRWVMAGSPPPPQPAIAHREIPHSDLARDGMAGERDAAGYAD